MAGPERVRKAIASNLQSTIRDLQRRKARGRRGLALIEGVRLVEEALAAGLPFQGALVAPDLARTARGVELVAELERHAIPVEEIGARTFAQLAETETPQGIMAVIEPRRWAVAEFAPRPEAVALVFDGVQDPGNVGTLIRSAHALAAADGTPLHRALGMGSGNGGPIAVIVGIEGAGIRPQLNAVAAQRVAIPLAQGAESLNVAVAAGILLYEVTRGR